MGTSDTVVSRLERLEAENRALRGRVEQLEGPSGVNNPVAEDTVSRRDVLRRARSGATLFAVGALGGSIAALTQASPAFGANGDAVTVGGTFDATAPTVLRNLANTRPVLGVQSGSSGTAITGGSASGEGVFGASNSLYGVHGTSNVATGVYGDTISGTGVQGDAHGAGTGVAATSDSGPGLSAASKTGIAISAGSDTGPGLIASSTSDIGVNGISNSATGVSGFSTSGDGVRGQSESATGVIGSSGSHTVPHALANTGVIGIGTHGRGGVFQGDLAQVRLVASPASTHPTAGTRGDLFVDRSGRLWFCKGGSSWKQLA